MKANRDISIDIVRGIAIVLMVGANILPSVQGPHPFALRVLSSLAAPIFICLAGTMMALSARGKSSTQPFSYFLKRGLFLVGIGVSIDVFAWNYIPFVGVDVLYLIGVALPLLHLAAQQPSRVVLSLALLIFGLTPLLQAALGYVETPLTPDLDLLPALSSTHFNQVMRHWVVDGWFPLFPWLGYALFGVWLGQWRWRSVPGIRYFDQKASLVLGATLFGLGGVSMFFFPGPLYPRMGYSELFYPATLGFVAASLGAVILIIAAVDAVRHLRLGAPLRVFGEASLFMYIAHSLVIGFCIEPFWSAMSPAAYVGLYVSLLGLLLFCGYMLRRLRKNHRSMPLMLKWVVGG